MGIIWTILIGFLAGILAKFVTPGDNEPSGFILTTILGIIGAVVATYLGQGLGWYGPNEGAGLLGAAVSAIIVLLVWSFVGIDLTMHVRRPSRPLSAGLVEVDSARDTKHLIKWQTQANLPSRRRPLGECLLRQSR